MAETKDKIKALSYNDALVHLKKGVLSPVYIIFGEEKYLQDDLIDRIIKISINPAMKDFNLDIFYASETDVEKIINVARSFPMMDERRVIIVKDIQDFKTTESKHLTNYFQNISRSSCMVVTTNQKKISVRLTNQASVPVVTIDCRTFYENEIPGWIENYLKAKNLEMEMQAIHLMQAQVGNSLFSLVNELEKVQINIHPRTKITLADIQNVTSISKQFNVFELSNAVGDKNFSRTIAILNKLLQQGESATGMIVQLTRHFVHLLKINEGYRQGKRSANELMKMTGLSYYFVNDMMRQAKNFSIEQLRNSFEILAEADLHLKTGYQKPDMVMELLLFKLINR
jgi:DNA polymerase-3 subunit delta